MSTLNKLPDGSPSPKYKCIAESYVDGERKEVILTEWWWQGHKVESIEESATGYFYGEAGFDKGPFHIIALEKIPDE